MRKLLLLSSLGMSLLVAQDHDRDRNHDRDRDDHRYSDRDRRDSHEWNDHEDRAWRMYRAQRHQGFIDWNRASERERRRYWLWRRQHSDAILHIEVH